MSEAILDVPVEEVPAVVKARRGPRTPYVPKHLPNVVLYFTAKTKRVVDAAAKRTKRTRSTVIEYLIRTYVPTLQAHEIGKHRPRVRPNPCVSLTLYAKQLLDEAEDRVARNRSDITEALVLKYGPTLRRADFEF